MFIFPYVYPVISLAFVENTVLSPLDYTFEELGCWSVNFCFCNDLVRFWYQS